MWQYGTYKPVANPWSWHRLTNMIWIEQPVGTGFSLGTPTATNEDDVATQFMGFWKNFIDLFGMQGYKVYIAGESYAGNYCPYIASHFLDANDTTYFDMKGVLIYDPILTHDEVQEQIPAVHFVDYWKGLHPFNDTFNAYIHNRSLECGYTDFVETYLVYPPAGQQPNKLPGTDADGSTLPECYAIFDEIIEASMVLNPCWDIYQVATTCPLLWDVLGFPGTLEYLPEGTEIYFNREDVKKAIHAPIDKQWAECSGPVFVDKLDKSLPSGLTVLPGVIDRTQNVIIAHGALDFVLIANGSLLAIQNMTWGGKLGFQSKPIEPFYVPYHEDKDLSTLAGAGVFGTSHSERGLTYVGIDLSGHMVPQYAPTAAFRNLEFLLGRVKSMEGKEPFTVDAGYPQSDGELGFGTAPQGWSDRKRTCPKKTRRETRPRGA
jgi:carboxypeptidase D